MVFPSSPTLPFANIFMLPSVIGPGCPFVIAPDTLPQSDANVPELVTPRATLHLLRAGRAHAALRGRDHVLPDDIKAIAIPVLAHRVILSGESQLSRRSAADVLSDLLDRTRVPAQPR